MTNSLRINYVKVRNLDGNQQAAPYMYLEVSNYEFSHTTDVKHGLNPQWTNLYLDV